MDSTQIAQIKENLPADYRFLLDPVTLESPCGEDLEYDPRYMELFIRIVPKEKKVIGGSLGSERLESEYEPVRWSEVERDCIDILTRTRDIRLLTVWLRCRTQQAGATGLRQGLLVLDSLLRLWPEDIYPRMETEGDPDLLPRSDTLLALAENRGLLADIRGLLVAGSGGLRLEMRDVERSFSIPLPEDALPPEGMRHRLEDLRSRSAPDFLALLDCLRLARSIDEHAREQLGPEAPDLAPLLELLGRLDTVVAGGGSSPEPSQEEVEQVASQVVATELSGPSPGAALEAFPSSAALPLGIANRHVARERIREVRLWFEEHEPSSPVPVLLRQAEQLIGRRFADLVHCLPDELLERWENE